MAEFVLRRSEETILELEQMQQVGLFTEDEIKAIVKRTTSHEYKLVRRVKVKKDFLAYIQYKIHLLALIKKRRKRIGYFFKKDEIEFAIISKIHRLFKQCTFRWPEDLKLWLSHIEFCKEWNKKVQLSKIWTALLQLHGNTNFNLWALAAKWELEDNHSVNNARQVFLRGIRHFPKSSKLWQEYFRMELMNVMKTRQRLALLQDGEEDIRDLTEDHLKGQVAQIVYNNAIKAIPDDSKFKCELLEIALIFSFFAGDVINTIIDDIMENYSNDPYVRSTLAKLHLNPHVMLQSEKDSDVAHRADAKSAEKRCWGDFEAAVLEVDSPEMWQECVLFLYSRISKNRSSIQEQTGFELTTQASKCIPVDTDPDFSEKLEKFIHIFEKGHRLKKLTPECYLKYADHLVASGKGKRAFQLLQECLGYLDSVELRVKQLELATVEEIDLESIKDLVTNLSCSISKMNPKQEKIFRVTWLNYAMMRNDESYAWEAVEDAKKCNSSILSEVVLLYYNWRVASIGIERGFELYKAKLRPLCPTSVELLETVVKGMKESPSSGNAIMQCYEDAIDDFGKNEIGFWLDYISHVQKIDPAKVGILHWKAMKSLNSCLVDEFLEKYALSQVKTESQVSPVTIH